MPNSRPSCPRIKGCALQETHVRNNVDYCRQSFAVRRFHSPVMSRLKLAETGNRDCRLRLDGAGARRQNCRQKTGGKDACGKAQFHTRFRSNGEAIATAGPRWVDCAGLYRDRPASDKRPDGGQAPGCCGSRPPKPCAGSPGSSPHCQKRCRRPGRFKTATAIRRYGQRASKGKLIASKGGMETGSSLRAVAIRTHSPPRSSKASRSRAFGIDKPEVGDALAGIDRPLAVPVEIACRRRKHLADPVGRQGEEGRVGKVRHPLAPPAGDVGHQDVLAEMQLRLVDDPPAAGAAFAEVERIADLTAQNGTGARMRRGRSRMGVERSLDDFGDHVRRRVDHVLIGRGAFEGFSGRLGPGHVSGLRTDDARTIAYRYPGQ